MPNCCCRFLCHCCPTKTQKTDIETETKPKKINENDLTLTRVHWYGSRILQTIVEALLITVVMWLLVRLPEPQVHVTSFQVEALTTNPNSTLIHFNLTIHNPDMFKSLHYDALILRINRAGYRTRYGATFNFNKDPKSGKYKRLYQSPGETTLLHNNIMDFNDVWSMEMVQSLLPPTESKYIQLKFVVEASVRAFNRVVARRQLMRVGRIYFHKDIKDPKNKQKFIPDGTAYIDPTGGLRLT